LRGHAGREREAVDGVQVKSIHNGPRSADATEKSWPRPADARQDARTPFADLIASSGAEQLADRAGKSRAKPTGDAPPPPSTATRRAASAAPPTLEAPSGPREAQAGSAEVAPAELPASGAAGAAPDEAGGTAPAESDASAVVELADAALNTGAPPPDGSIALAVPTTLPDPSAQAVALAAPAAPPATSASARTDQLATALLAVGLGGQAVSAAARKADPASPDGDPAASASAETGATPVGPDAGLKAASAVPGFAAALAHAAEAAPAGAGKEVPAADPKAKAPGAPQTAEPPTAAQAAKTLEDTGGLLSNSEKQPRHPGDQRLPETPPAAGSEIAAGPQPAPEKAAAHGADQHLPEVAAGQPSASAFHAASEKALHSALDQALPQADRGSATPGPDGAPAPVPALLPVELPFTRSAHAALLAASSLAAPGGAIPTPQPVPLAAVAVEIGAKALAGMNRFEIRLDPEELGKVEVRLDIDAGGGVKAHLIVDRVDTLALLQRDAKTLERSFEQAGLRPSEGGIDLSLRNPEPDGRGQRRGEGQPQRPDLPEPKRGLPAGDDGEAPAPVTRRFWTSSRGVDLRI
jgi:flagellar hook-length control protein FliK